MKNVEQNSSIVIKSQKKVEFHEQIVTKVHWPPQTPREAEVATHDEGRFELYILYKYSYIPIDIVDFLSIDSNAKPTKPKKGRSLVKANKFKPRSAQSVELHEIVCCYIRGWPEWPATITEINGRNVTVKFFGDDKNFTTSLMNIYKFHECGEIMSNKVRGRKDPLYARSIQEAELVLGIPPELSILNCGDMSS